MPCQSDYMQASGAELESRRVCKLLVYLLKCIDKNVPGWITDAWKNYYGNANRLDEATRLLCEHCRGLTEKEREKFIYDAHDKNARKLADWWERHQEWDRRRVSEEKEARKMVTTRERALRKLTIDEMKALGLVDENAKLGRKR